MTFPPRCLFNNVLTGELEELKELRGGNKDKIVLPLKSDAIYDQAYDSQLAGLSFSGGGIRSATFNLGVIQALARKRLLSRFDYLSTVSGGGYIGAWLSALLHRSKNQNLRLDKQATQTSIDEKTSAQCEVLLKPHPFKTPHDDGCDWTDVTDGTSWDASAKIERRQRSGFKKPHNCGFPPSEHSAVRFLRRYSNYLTPRTGLSGDTLALISLFLRNLVLMQIALALLIAVVLLAVFAIVFGADAYADQENVALMFGVPRLLVLAMAALLVAMVFSALLIWLYEKHADSKPGGAALKVNFLVVLPITASAAMFVLAVSQIHNPQLLDPYWTWIKHPAIAYFAIWILGVLGLVLHKETRGHILSLGPRKLVWIVVSSAAAAAVLGGLLWLAATLLTPSAPTAPLNPLVVIIVGPPAMLMVFSFAVTIHMFLARRAFSDGHREWWARLGGFILFVAFAWLSLFSIALFSWPLITWLGNGGIVVLATWLSGSAIGAWLAKKPDPETQSQASEKVRQAVTKLAPLLFMLGLVVLVAYLLVVAMISMASPNASLAFSVNSEALGTNVWHALNTIRDLDWHNLLWPAAILLGAFVVAMWLDGNLFSLHTMYRNRLIRAYLGASNENAADLNQPPNSRTRNRHPFTGFARDDDIPLRMLQKQRPIPLINTTINMTGGDELAWQTRRAAAFCFTPYHAGYETKTTDGWQFGRYRSTAEFAGDITLGTAFSVSGAAASPNMGYHTSSTVAALLTAFNLRLGYWAGNVEHARAWKKASPVSFLSPLIAELTGSASGKAKWVNLTDGGHFENLGIYELVRRRCRLIVATDVGCDPERKLTDLANMVRKCWTDFGVHIQFDTPLTELDLRKPDKQISENNALIGIIEYPVDDSIKIKQYGVLVYLKATLTPQIAERFPDIRQYADTHKTFPHETTVDQFFDEEQFEAYRHLGFRIAQSISTDIEQHFESLAVHPDKLAKALVDKINATRTATNQVPAKDGDGSCTHANAEPQCALDVR